MPSSISSSRPTRLSNCAAGHGGLQVLDAAIGVGDEERLVLRSEEAGAVAPRLPMETKFGMEPPAAPSSLAAIEPMRGIGDAALPFAIAGVHVVLGAGVRAFRRRHAANDDAVVHHARRTSGSAR